MLFASSSKRLFLSRGPVSFSTGRWFLMSIPGVRLWWYCIDVLRGLSALFLAPSVEARTLSSSPPPTAFCSLPKGSSTPATWTFCFVCQRTWRLLCSFLPPSDSRRMGHLRSLSYIGFGRVVWLPPGCKPSPPLKIGSQAKHCVLRDNLSALVRFNPTGHTQRAPVFYHTFCTLLPAPCSLWSILLCIS